MQRMAIKVLPCAITLDKATINALLQAIKCSDRKAVNLLLPMIPNAMEVLINALFHAIKCNDHEAAKALLPFIPDTVINKEHNSVLSLVLWREKPDGLMVKLLLDHGADPNIEIANDLQPLQRTVQLKSLKIAKLLIDADADPDKESSCGMNAMEFAKELDWQQDYKRYLMSPENNSHDSTDFLSDKDRGNAHAIFDLLSNHSLSYRPVDADIQYNENDFQIGHWQENEQEHPQQETFTKG